MTNKDAIKNLEAIKKQFHKYEFTQAIELAIKALEERPQGEWVDDTNYYANCSNCGYQIDTHYERGYLNFCPNCGADMRGDKT